jgi:large subunit ribosomal protein L17
MRHQVRGRALGRTSAHKRALRRNVLRALFTHERIVTTVAKAKEFRPSAERLITLAKTKDLARFRRALAFLPDEEVVAKLFGVLGPRFATRPGGYTRILKLEKPRLGDNAPRAIFELVERTPKAEGEAAPEVGTEAAPTAEDVAKAKERARPARAAGPPGAAEGRKPGMAPAKKARPQRTKRGG